MTSSGTINTSRLAESTIVDNWLGTGSTHLQPKVGGDSVIIAIGGTDVGGIDRAFTFNDGTDFSAWVHSFEKETNPFAGPKFGWTATGTKGFATFGTNHFGSYVPGLHLLESQMDGPTWTPDQSWSISGSFSSLGMRQGTHTVVDSVSGEFMTYQIGPVSTNPVPEPSTAIAMGVLGVLGFAGNRRRRRQS